MCSIMPIEFLLKHIQIYVFKRILTRAHKYLFSFVMFTLDFAKTLMSYATMFYDILSYRTLQFVGINLRI